MSQLSDLLEGVLARRDDDAPRRVYADALLEAGDPLGEFIHVQCDLSAGGLSRDEAIKRRRRERELLGAHRERWTAGLPWAPRDFRFVRGFVEQLEVSAELWVEKGEELFAAAPALRAVTLSGLQLRAYDHGGAEATAALLLKRLEAAVQSPLLARLDGFGQHAVGYVPSDPIWELSETVASREEELVWLEREAMELLLAADLSHLRELFLWIAEAEPMEALAASPVLGNLERLDLMHGALDPAAVLNALEPSRLRALKLNEWHEGLFRFPDLHELEIAGGRRPLSHLPPGLRRLSCRLKTLTAEAVAVMSACSQLMELELFADSAPGWHALQHPGFRGVRHLRLGWAVELKELRALAKWPIAEKLEVLQLKSATAAELEELESAIGCIVEVRAY